MFINSSDTTTTAGTLSNIATITMGQSPNGNSYNENAVGEVFYQGRAEFGFRFPTRHLFTTEPKRMAEADDVLLSVRAPVGDFNVAYERCCIGRGLGSIHSKDGNSSFILYTMFALKPQLDVFNGEGTVFGSINRDALNAIPLRIPAADKIAQFEALVHPMDDLIRLNYEEICRLEKIRNFLLPKLMSGEIDVSAIKL
ncbi:MAG: restriction endonuclease subunit S [Lachnospira sp.]|nr:restriction endonuclease subunit S [Lachnospira sp.]